MTILAKGYAEQIVSPDRLVASHMNLVRKIAWHMHGRVGRMVEIDDLLQVGYIGLVDASQRYVPKPGVSFAAYAKIRIRGSIVDYLRSNSSMCRATIAMHQKVKLKTSKLEQELMRGPTVPVRLPAPPPGPWSRTATAGPPVPRGDRGAAPARRHLEDH